MITRSLWCLAVSALLAACGALSVPRKDAGASLVGGGAGGGGADGGGSGGGAGGGGGGGSQAIDAGWPVTELPADAFTVTERPGFQWNDKQSLLSWNGRLFYANNDRVFVEAIGQTWAAVNLAVSVDLLALRATPEGPLLVTLSKEQVLCDAACRGGASSPRSVDLPFGVFLERACGGGQPVVVRSLRGEYYQLVDGGWPSLGDPGASLSPGPCFRLRDGAVMISDNDRIRRLLTDGGSRYETPSSRYLPITDFAETSFGLAAMGYSGNELLIEDGGTWASVAKPGGDDWMRGFTLPDGRLLIVGLKTLTVVSQGSLRRWALPRPFDTRRESIAMSPEGTVWVVARFVDPLGDPENHVVGYTLR